MTVADKHSPDVKLEETKFNDRGNAIEWTATCVPCDYSVSHIAKVPTLRILRNRHLDRKHPGHGWTDF